MTQSRHRTFGYDGGFFYVADSIFTITRQSTPPKNGADWGMGFPLQLNW